MKFSASSLVSLLVLSEQSAAFSVQLSQAFGMKTQQSMRAPMYARPAPLQASTNTEPELGGEVQRLKAMAAKLRAEAADLEAKQADERAIVTALAFKKFDMNNDGEITLDELKATLEETFKMDLPQDRVERLMKDFDKSGDGKLQQDEFYGVEQFRNRLDFLAQEERKIANQAAKVAQKESEVSKLIESQLELVNDKPPTDTDKVVSVLPYLLPLMDGLMFGQFLLQGADNPAVASLFALYTLYRSIPLGGFLAFFALNSLTNNLSINRLVRYNIQQAVLLDVALFVPGLIGMLITAAASSGLGLQLPPGIGELGCDAVFITLLATLGYSSISSLLGTTPDKVPFISKVVNDRMPSFDVSMFDAEGRFDPRKMNVNDDNETDQDSNKRAD